LKGRKVKWVSSGAQHSAVVTDEGELLVCGSYLHGKLGIEGLTSVNISVFQPVTALHGLKVKQVECGDYHTLCLLEDGVVYTWGGTLHKVIILKLKE
jgi:RCC1 and BTB domain-containing protein